MALWNKHQQSHEPVSLCFFFGVSFWRWNLIGWLFVWTGYGHVYLVRFFVCFFLSELLLWIFGQQWVSSVLIILTILNFFYILFLNLLFSHPNRFAFRSAVSQPSANSCLLIRGQGKSVSISMFHVLRKLGYFLLLSFQSIDVIFGNTHCLVMFVICRSPPIKSTGLWVWIRPTELTPYTSFDIDFL